MDFWEHWQEFDIDKLTNVPADETWNMPQLVSAYPCSDW
jgi:hypothetical protein